MSKSDEKLSKRKSKDGEVSVTGESKPEKKEKKEKRDKKERKEKKDKSKRVAEPAVESAGATTEDVEMKAEEPTTATEAKVVSEDTSSKKRKRAKDAPTTEGKSADEEKKSEEDLLEIDPDAPTPLSKAQARAARKEAKRKRKAGEGTDGSDDEDEKETGVDGERKSKRAKKDKSELPKPPKRQHSVWIGNLAFKTNPESLKAWLEREIILLSKGGGAKPEDGAEEEEDEPEEGDDDEVDEETEIVTRVNMPMKQGRFGVQNQGFAYVDFKTRRFQKLGVRLSEKMIDGRRLLIKYGDDYGAKADARTPKPVTSIPAGALPKSQPHNASATLFMGNLPFDATEEAIWDFVERNAIEATKGRKKSKKGKGRRGKKSEGGAEDSESESESESEAEEDKPEEELGDDEAKAILENKSKQSQVAGLRRVRMPLFEDSGKCKGFAFLDFKSVEQATLALANRRNHFLYNRKLKMQYASDSATKRSLPASQRNRPPMAEGEEGTAAPARPSGRYFDNGNAETEEKKEVRGKKWESAGRPKPGAALSMAKRESVAIVAGQGKKITF